MPHFRKMKLLQYKMMGLMFQKRTESTKCDMQINLILWYHHIYLQKVSCLIPWDSIATASAAVALLVHPYSQWVNSPLRAVKRLEQPTHLYAGGTCLLELTWENKLDGDPKSREQSLYGQWYRPCEKQFSASLFTGILEKLWVEYPPSLSIRGTVTRFRLPACLSICCTLL